MEIKHPILSQFYKYLHDVYQNPLAKREDRLNAKIQIDLLSAVISTYENNEEIHLDDLMLNVITQPLLPEELIAECKEYIVAQ